MWCWTLEVKAWQGNKAREREEERRKKEKCLCEKRNRLVVQVENNGERKAQLCCRFHLVRVL